MLTTTPMLFLPFILTPKKKNIPTTYASSRTQDMKIKGKNVWNQAKL